MEPQLEHEVSLLHATICQALADPTRILILCALDDGPEYVPEMAELLDAQQPTVSRHLKILRDRALVICERDGAQVRYSLADERVIEALDAMREVLLGTLARRAQLVGGLRRRARRAPLGTAGIDRGHHGPGA